MKNFKKVFAFLLAFVFIAALVKVPFTTKADETAAQSVIVKIKYSRADNDYSDWDVWTWDAKGNPGTAKEFSGVDSEGAYLIMETTSDSDLGFIIRKKDWSDKFAGEDIKPDLSQGDVEYLAVESEDGSRNLSTREFKKAFDKVTLNLHYYRFDEDYTNWDLWAWANEGNSYEFTDDDFGKVTTAEFSNVDEETNIGFIVRKNDWSQKDWEGDRFINKAYMNADGVVDAYIVSGQEKVYYSKEAALEAIEIAKNPRVTEANINGLKEVQFAVNSKVSQDLALKITSADGEEVPYESIELDESGLSGIVYLSQDLDLNKNYTLTIEGLEGKQLMPGKVYDSEEFANAYTYNGELGAVYSKIGTTFTLWAPTASDVKVALYGTDGKNIGEAEKVLPMTKGENGSWSLNLAGDQKGQFYNYLVTIDGTTNEVVDPYAKAVGVNGNQGMVVDLASTNPEGWNEDTKPVLEDPTDAIIYEMHIRDFSISDNSGISLEYKGKYNGVWQEGTTIPGTDVKTGVDHLKELGVNVVHILPTFDHQSIDETKLDVPQFNWGYDPKNYNVPEGSYSSDPYTGTIRIEEFKKMVQELHKAGIRVVMDVVYNHTGATLDSNLNLAVPNYYYRQSANGTFSNGSGCGNETASERSMVRKFMVDSVTYWAKEYHIDGFRFDLMGLHDIDTMKEIRTELNKIDDSILMYGEGWTGGDSPLASDKAATKANTPKYGELQIAAFSDDMRDGIKGHVFTTTAPAFVNGGQGFEETIKFGIVASTANDQVDSSKVANQTKAWANEPYQTINYASAHDNFTLWDKLQTTNPEASRDELVQMNKMSAAIIYTSQGIPFMQAGEEMARTKVNEDGTFNENSYNAPDSVNQIDWERKVEYSDLYDYYKGLISMRKAHKAFRMNTTEEIQNSIKFLDTDLDLPANVVAYNLNGETVNDVWKNIMVLFNANDTDVEIPLYNGDLDWEIVVNGESAGVKSLGSIKGSEGSVVVPAHSSYVLVDKESYEASIADNNNPSDDDNNNDNNNPSNDDKNNNNNSSTGDNNNNNSSNNSNNNNSSTTTSKTGDYNNIVLILGLVIVSAAGVIVFSRKKKIS